MSMMMKSKAADSGPVEACSVVQHLTTCQAVKFLLPEEQILFSFQSINEEFTFTNFALIKMTSRRTSASVLSRAECKYSTSRLDFKTSSIEDVRYQTPGRQDVELRFTIGGEYVAINIARDNEQDAQLYYKVLLLLSRAQQERNREWEFARLGLEQSAKALRLTEGSGQTLTKQANETLQWLQETYERTHPTVPPRVDHWRT
ncbi:TPA: hypothetical protein N0F65_005495 [Lagenidium giganteum]|uniref:Bacterial Pleckstrin homology domain-containing protein n=1 Tax=Lagenidium giganteum TaxID=4803 RepID=A0AAV2YKY0_9STRA|nr:TPA: hypothetical protein N0F65_005495 [Lagenidium giganteum]